MWTLDERIKALHPELSEWRTELQTQLRTLREAGNHLAVILAMAPLCLRLLEQVYQISRRQPPSSADLHVWIEDLNGWVRDANNRRQKRTDRQIIPDEIADYLHELRRRHNQAQHDPMSALALKPEDAEIALEMFLRVLQWFYCDCPSGPKLQSIYFLPQRPRHRKVFTLPPNAPNFVDRETEIAQLDNWFEQEGQPVFVIGAIGGQGKTYLAAKFVERLRLKEKAVQVRWVECNENLSLDDLLEDFAEEMQGRNVSEARMVKDSQEALRTRLDSLVRYLEHTPDRWLLVLDDYHKLQEDRSNWDEFVRFINQRCLRTKVLIITRREPEVLDEPKLPIGTYEELRLLNLPVGTAQEYLGLLDLSVNEEISKIVWEKCNGSPLAMKLFAQAAKRRSIESVLALPLPEWSANARAWLSELQRDLSDEAKEAAKILAFLNFMIEEEGVDRELLLAVGATEDGLQELERGYFLEWDDEGHLWLHDLLQEYWLDKVINEAASELGDEFKAKLYRGEFEKRRIRLGLTDEEPSLEEEFLHKEQERREDAIHAILEVGGSKLDDWLFTAAEWLVEQGNWFGIHDCVPWVPPDPPFCLSFMARKKFKEGNIAEAERLWIKALPGIEEFASTGACPGIWEYFDVIINLASVALDRKEVIKARDYYARGLQTAIDILFEMPDVLLFECNKANKVVFCLDDEFENFLDNLVNFILQYIEASKRIEKIKAKIDIMKTSCFVIEGCENDSELVKDKFILLLQELLDLLQETSEDLEIQ